MGRTSRAKEKIKWADAHDYAEEKARAGCGMEYLIGIKGKLIQGDCLHEHGVCLYYM